VVVDELLLDRPVVAFNVGVYLRAAGIGEVLLYPVLTQLFIKLA